MTTLLEQHQSTMTKMHLNLAFQCDNGSKNIYRNKCLIDTGCNLPLIINQETAKALKIKVEKDIVRLKVADNNGLKAKKVKIKVILETLDNDFSFGCTALIIPNEETCIIGTPLLEAICKKTKTDFVLNFLQSKIELR